MKITEQQKMVAKEQTNVERAREQCDQADLKVQALEKRIALQLQENNDLFKQTSDALLERDQALKQVSQARQEKEKAEQELILAKSDIQYYTLEIKNFENTVLRLTKELDD